jgi:hypothetical protein
LPTSAAFTCIGAEGSELEENPCAFVPDHQAFAGTVWFEKSGSTEHQWEGYPHRNGVVVQRSPSSRKAFVRSPAQIVPS